MTDTSTDGIRELRLGNQKTATANSRRLLSEFFSKRRKHDDGFAWFDRKVAEWERALPMYIPSSSISFIINLRADD